jgi:SAM-dependent methyltransferase
LLSSEEVILAYRLFLGRDPESQDVVNNLCQTVHDITQLREVFMQSPEFVEGMSKALGQEVTVRRRHPFTNSFTPVEVSVSDDMMARMFVRIQEQWSLLGVSEPFWSVVTQPQYYRDQFEANKAQFNFSGDGLCYLFLSALRRNDINPNEIHSVFELGCGTGRITAYLAKQFNRVIAGDISLPHLDLAKTYLATEAIGNVELVHLHNMQAFYNLPKVDAIFTVITLQHNPPPVSAWILRNLLNALNPGGVAYFQMPSYKNGYLFEAERYLNTPPPSTFEMHFLPQKDIFRIIAESNCHCLEIREDGMVGNEDQMLSNTFLVQKHA